MSKGAARNRKTISLACPAMPLLLSSARIPARTENRLPGIRPRRGLGQLDCRTPSVTSSACTNVLELPGLAEAISPPRTIGSVALRLGQARTAFWITAALAILSLGTVVGVVVFRAYGFSEPETVTVMTRNIYLGGDITRPIRAALDRKGPEGVLALGHANHELREIVDRTDFTTRSKLLAAEIAAARPDLVGLQEVALWRHGPLQLDQIGRPDASEVDYDFLATLVADLAARGIRYEIVQVQQESDVEAPAFTGNPFSGTAGSAEDVRLADRDVILVRSGSGIKIDGSGGGQFSQQFTVN